MTDHTMAAPNDKLLVAAEMGATRGTVVLDSRLTERVSGSKKASTVWHFIHRLVNGPAMNRNGCNNRDT